MENTTVTAAVEQQPAEALPVPPELPASMKAAIDDTVMLLLDKEEVTYLARMVEVRLLEIIPDGYDLDWLIGMVDLAKKLRKR